ncbi:MULTISPECIES: heparinase II/III family protein [Gammaproteobacteria]|uniref:heparinase II/III family protein n=1 Tax=Gammaproteobacteria TaxID=1236 RepID=UPI000DD0BE9A|nr:MULTISPECIES: heparinase II/III family protein [Gammaproteobacteria]RTE86059.1 alginate lyase family protein [Aliidiomarina sp. B3213]TCZ91413.1 alginate lyase family protein [Lysobacter sp. N42]
MFLQKLRVVRLIGVVSVVRFVLYRALLKLGVFKLLTPMRETSLRTSLKIEAISGCPRSIPSNSKVIEVAEELTNGFFRQFGWRKIRVKKESVELAVNGKNYERHWSDVNLSELEDVKLVWDISRFSWVPTLSSAYLMTGDLKYLRTMQNWLSDWTKNNPVNAGLNWVCGQEVSIRLLNYLTGVTALTHSFFDIEEVEEFVLTHCRRVRPTILYSISQDNNHAVTEAAALFIGGVWLRQFGQNRKVKIEGCRLQEKGRKILEERINRLVLSDGGFAMYSVTYHRVVLNTLSLVEIWRKHFSLNSFSLGYQEKCKVATRWLACVVDKESGDAPNLGANDGSNPFVIEQLEYRDFRPSIRLAGILFLKENLFPSAIEGEILLELFKIKNRLSSECRFSQYAGDLPASGLFVARKELKDSKIATCFLKYPVYEYRPAQCDALHLDFWVNGENLLRDGGTFSYNAKGDLGRKLGSVESHNTAQFDYHDQMPRISKFLLGNWLRCGEKKVVSTSNGFETFSVSYLDRFGCKHHRCVEFNESHLVISDHLSGFSSRAVLRFRLPMGNWSLRENIVKNDKFKFIFTSNVEITRISLLEDLESRYYFQIDNIIVIEVEIREQGFVRTKVVFEL